MSKNSKEHWEKVYETKMSHEVSWTQEVPEASLNLIKEIHLPKTASIIDIGGGDSKLVDHLLDMGFQDITVLDISSKALERLKTRLGHGAEKVKFITSNVIDFIPIRSYDLWHDRATFHFLTEPNDIELYMALLHKHVNRHLVMGTFSDKGPKKCSGLSISNYSEDGLTQLLKKDFLRIKCFASDHITPFGTAQNYLFCRFEKSNNNP